MAADVFERILCFSQFVRVVQRLNIGGALSQTYLPFSFTLLVGARLTTEETRFIQHSAFNSENQILQNMSNDGLQGCEL
jgi:hypothetical protein